jgi:hypothetical protein
MFAALLLSALPLATPQGDEPTGQATVYRLDYIETLAGDSLKNASIVVRDGVIERIGQAVIVPDNARVIDLRGTGSVAMPPFVLGQANLLPGDSRGRGAYGRYVASEVYRADADKLADLREAGVLLMGLVPPGSGIPGRTSVIRSDAKNLAEDALVSDLHLMMTIDMSKSSKDLLRKAFTDADAAIEKEGKARTDWEKARKEWNEKQKAAAEEAKKKEEGGKEGGKAPDEPKKGDDKEPSKEFEAPRIDPNIQPLIDLINNERVVQIWISSPGEWLHWLDVVGEREIAWEVVLDHGRSTNLNEVVASIVESGVRVYLPAQISTLPSTRLRMSLPAELLAAGLKKMVLLPSSINSMRAVEGWRVGLGDLVNNGLDRSAALRAVSVEAAAAMGQEELIAPLESGAPASFVILEGDPLNPLARVSHLVAAGEVIYDRAKEDKEN